MAIPDLPPVPSVPAGAHYSLYRISGNILYLSGNGPLLGNTIPPDFTGAIGRDVSIDHGYQAARLTAMNLLLVARSAIKTLDNVVQLISVEGNVNCTDDFYGQPTVINGCSDFLIEIFGDAGKHTRSAVGNNSLAFNICCEISLTLEFK